ncbi:PDZ domain-containing protein [Sphingomonas fennica]|uniref:PDZ domain-containing protein n=1 Tax=Edaphosphingomonas fennica TaxID=114404 RepID=UPI0011B1C7B2|nr:hypothetical protein [Sphingomonas fennica]
MAGMLGSSLSGPIRDRLIIVAAAAMLALAAAALIGHWMTAPAAGACQDDAQPYAAAAPLPGLTLEPIAALHALAVTSLRSGGQAQRMGVRVGDLVESIDGRHVETLSALTRMAGAQFPGIVSLRMRRGMQFYDIRLVRLGHGCGDTQDPRH